MTFELLDTVVLSHDLPEHGLRAGDLGAIVESYGKTSFEVEFVRPSGHTQALVSLTDKDLRALDANDVFAVRAS